MVLIDSAVDVVILQERKCVNYVNGLTCIHVIIVVHDIT